jgi:hypothetical protein
LSPAGQGGRTIEPVSKARRSRRIALALCLTGAAALAAGAYVFWPRTAQLRAFDPNRVAQLETAMWRAYYEHRYAALLGNLYLVNRDDYGFSPADSLALAWYAALAAKTFQPTRSRAEAQTALPTLERYFAVMRAHGGEAFDPKEAARLELDWWQLRREDAPPFVYGLAIARTTSAIYGVDNEELRRAGMLRARMMSYRDERGNGRMQESDWLLIENGLVLSYEALRAGIR